MLATRRLRCVNMFRVTCVKVGRSILWNLCYGKVWNAKSMLFLHDLKDWNRMEKTPVADPGLWQTGGGELQGSRAKNKEAEQFCLSRSYRLFCRYLCIACHCPLPFSLSSKFDAQPWSTYIFINVRKTVAHTRLPSVGFRSWSRFFAVSLQLTWVINPAVGRHYFPPAAQLPSKLLRGLLPISLLGEQRHGGCEQFA